jgi:hypothetical protein
LSADLLGIVPIGSTQPGSTGALSGKSVFAQFIALIDAVGDCT